MRFVENHQIPGRVCNVRGLITGKLVRADYDVVGFERTELSLADGSVVGLRFKDAAREEKFLREFLMPLLAKI